MKLLPGQLHWGISSSQPFLRGAGEWDLEEREQEHSHPGCWDQIEAPALLWQLCQDSEQWWGCVDHTPFQQNPPSSRA